MRVAVTGCQCVGKSTFVQDFLKTWPMYSTPTKTYRDLVKAKKLQINRGGNKEGQMTILNYHIDEIQRYSKEDNVIVDRCVLDPLAYALWLYEKGTGNVTDDDIELMMRLVKESLKLYDIVFWLPLNEANPIPFPVTKPVPMDFSDGKPQHASEQHLRDNDETYRKEMNNIFMAFNNSYVKRTGVIFPLEDCPALIDINGSRENRIAMVKDYIQPNGQPFGEETPSLIADTES